MPAHNLSFRRSLVLLALGVALVALANTSHGVAWLAWLAPVPWLRFLRTTRGVRSRLAFSIALIVAWCLATLKIVTEPLPLGFALLGVGFGLRELLAYLTWDLVQRRQSRTVSLIAFPAAMAFFEWAQYRFTSLSSWGGAGYTQVGQLAFLQIASVVGVVGAGFLVNAVAAGLELFIAPDTERRAPLVALAPIALAVAVTAWGAARLARPLGPEVTVATVDTTATFGASPALPSAAERDRIVTTLLADTQRAARAGARLVVWTEAAALALPEEEPGLVARAARLARAEHVAIVAAFIVPRSLAPLHYENKLVWLTPDGAVAEEYEKHHPVPGEPATPSSTPLRAITTPFGRAGVALCYDYDFPALAREHAALGVDLVALPSSDWRGIDPVHTEMAALRAIETGSSIVRSTRFGLSAGIDPLGRLRARRSSFDAGDRVNVLALPRTRQPTFYAVHGDVLVGGCGAYLLALVIVGLARKRRAGGVERLVAAEVRGHSRA